MDKTTNQFENQRWHTLAGRHTIKLLSSKSNPTLRLQQYDSQMAFILVLQVAFCQCQIQVVKGHSRHQSQGVSHGKFLVVNEG